MSEKNTPAPPEERCVCTERECFVRCAPCRARGTGQPCILDTPPAPLADGGEILTRETFEAYVWHMDGIESDAAKLLAHDAALRVRVAELERVIEEAEHGRFCMTFNVPPEPCDCFKSKAKVSR